MSKKIKATYYLNYEKVSRNSINKTHNLIGMNYGFDQEKKTKFKEYFYTNERF